MVNYRARPYNNICPAESSQGSHAERGLAQVRQLTRNGLIDGKSAYYCQFLESNIFVVRYLCGVFFRGDTTLDVKIDDASTLKQTVSIKW